MNPLAMHGDIPRALLVLEDGSVFEGYSAAAPGETFGEVVFNTSMVGYQEIVSDPSYAGQIVTLTYPQVGNYGVCDQDMEDEELALRGLVVRDLCRTPSNWRSSGSFRDLLIERGVVCIEGVDTRALTLTIREKGAMRGAISTVDLDPAHLLGRVRTSPSIQQTNFVAEVSCDEPRTYPALDGQARHRVVAYDCGEKLGILRKMRARGCEVTVVPWDTPAERVLELDPDGVFFSNGPGDPERVEPTARAVGDILGKKPVFGICLGNQMMAIAAGSRIEKLKYGHHGGNEPVMNLLTGRVEVTAQNHNYGLVFPSLGPIVPELSGGEADHHDDLRYWSQRRIAPVVSNERFGRIRLTHVNLNDGTPEGIQFLDIPAFSVQYHPESEPGPLDASYLFDAFDRLMDGDPDYLAIDIREGRRF